MVVDNKLFRPHAEQLKPGLFWVLEQIPGYVRREDLTEVLQARTFWPSYNSPYFSGQTTATSSLIIKRDFYPDVFNKSGNSELVEEYGDWFSYDKTPRALIFARSIRALTIIFPNLIYFPVGTPRVCLTWPPW